MAGLGMAPWSHLLTLVHDDVQYRHLLLFLAVTSSSLQVSVCIGMEVFATDSQAALCYALLSRRATVEFALLMCILMNKELML